MTSWIEKKKVVIQSTNQPPLIPYSEKAISLRFNAPNGCPKNHGEGFTPCADV
jgi:nitrate reductase cytochrome c-type subunit